MKDCIVIGAGPGGIVATKELLERGIHNMLCLEQADTLGGVFANTYDSLHLTSSAIFSMFSDYWVGKGKSHYFWTKHEVLTYWKDYAKHYNVDKKIQFNSKVISVTRLMKSTWEVTLDNGEVLHTQRLILAIGNNNIPKYPEWHNQLSDVTYVHSKEYKNADAFKGKRVLVVGGGESGSDVALEISRVAEKCWVSLRSSTGWVVPRKRGEHAADISTHRGIWNLPREFGQKLSPYILKLERARKDPVFDALADLNDRVTARNGIWGIYGTKTIALPQAIAKHGCKIVDGIQKVEHGGRQLTTSHGEILENVDAVVFCSGYTNRVPFMPPKLQVRDPRSLYKHMFHPNLGDSLAWIGWARPGFGSQFPIMEMQARLCGHIFKGEHKLPTAEQMRATITADAARYMQQFEENAERIRSLVDYFHFMDSMAAIIGCEPPLKKYLWRHPKLWLHLVYGPMQATQFRLRGPGEKKTLAHKFLRKMPISSFNHIVKAGIRGRIRYGLKALLSLFFRRPSSYVDDSIQRKNIRGEAV